MKKRLTAIILMLSVFTTGALAATTYKKSIEVEYGITLSINGQTPTLTDANGKTVQPFVYDGTTYVPIRAVAENMGGLIDYDGQTQTASVTSFGSEIELWTLQICTEASELCGYAAEMTAKMDGDTFASSAPPQSRIDTFGEGISAISQWSSQINGWISQIQPEDMYYREMQQLGRDLSDYASTLNEFYIVYCAFVRQPTTADATNLTQLDVRMANHVKNIRSELNDVTNRIFAVFD